jgi:superfamily I DNA/RNA helicase
MPLPSEFHFIGVPGAGKTTALENTIEYAINELGIAPHETRVVTYRASTAMEIKERLENRFNLSSSDSKEICSTLHGMATRFYISQLDDSDKTLDFMDGNWLHWNEFKNQYGHDMRPGGIDSPETNSQTSTAYTYFRNTGRDMDAVLNRGLYSDPDHLQKVADDLEEFKKKKNIIEFNDCLEHAAQENFIPDVRMILIDEAQDLNPLMTSMIDNFRGHIEYIGLAGDPFQSLYPFYGATSDYLTDFPNEFTLGETRRLHEEHYDIAKRIILGNTGYVPPEVKTKGKGGKVFYVTPEEAAERTFQHVKDNGVFHLCRTNYLCSQVAHNLAEKGIPYFGSLGWRKETVHLFNGLNKVAEGKALHYSELKSLQKNTRMFSTHVKLYQIEKIEKESKTKEGTKNYRVLMTDAIWNLKAAGAYTLVNDDNKGNIMKAQIKGLLNKGFKRISLSDAARVRVMTIHAGKGLEAETVFLYTEIPDTVSKGLKREKTATEEACVWYVGVSRSLKNLYVVATPGKQYRIPMPSDGWDVE